jgi:outer membrane immunogenic protein
MRKLSLAGVALAVLVVGPAMAADLSLKPIYKAPPAPVPVWNWTGCYVGGHVGGLWAHKDWTDHTVPSATYGQSLGGHDADSWVGGVQGGCDYQFVNGAVVGIQGDYGWTDANGSNANLLNPNLTDSTNIRSLSTITGRLGYAWDRFLGYVKGGGAWERDNYNIYGTIPGVAAVGTPVNTSASETRSGWTLGVGGEYAFTNNLSGFVEYNYYDFGTHDLAFTNGFTSGIKETKSVVRGGLNFRFGGWGAPVTAKY